LGCACGVAGAPAGKPGLGPPARARDRGANRASDAAAARPSLNPNLALPNPHEPCLTPPPRQYYYYHILSWPQLLHVADAGHGTIVGYVLAKMDDEPAAGAAAHGHVTSLAVARTHRRLGVASALMAASHAAMRDVFGAAYASLHVRVGNAAAVRLYTKTLGYAVHDVEAKYYADGEDAYDMRKELVPGGTARRPRSGRGG